MIKRIVKMEFQAEHVDRFLDLFHKQKKEIRHYPGCLYLELLRSLDEPQVFFTYSYWTGPEALESYRHSELFKRTWAATKVLFSNKPQAWSVDSITTLPADESPSE